MGFFDTPDAAGEDPAPTLAKAQDLSPGDKLALEKEVTGMYLSGHPLEVFAGRFATGRYARTIDVLRSAGNDESGEGELYQDGQRVAMLGMVTGMRRKATRSGLQMAFVTLEDLYGVINLLVFPRVLEEQGEVLREGAVIEASGRLSFQEEKEPELICDQLGSPQENKERASRAKGSSRPGLYLRVDSAEDPHYRKAMQYAAIFEGGSNDLYVYFKDTHKLWRAPAASRVDVSRPLIRALENLLGQENTKFVPYQ